MANHFDTQILSDSHKRTVIKCTGEFDGSGQETANVKIAGMSLSGALTADTNNNVLLLTTTGALNGAKRTVYRYNISRIVYDVNIPNGSVKIYWDGANTQPTAFNATGSGYYNSDMNIAAIPNNANGANGNLLFSTSGAIANSCYSIILELHKDNRDYDAGQINTPGDFNFKPGGFGPTP